MSNGKKLFTPNDVKKALAERLAKFELQLKDLHTRELRKDVHVEPSQHEADHGQPSHLEGPGVEGGHEDYAMNTPQHPPEQPVSSSHGIPAGQLTDLCPLCGQQDNPANGSCGCLNAGNGTGAEQAFSGNPSLNPTQPDPVAGLDQALALSEKKMVMEPLCKPHSKSMCKMCKKEEPVSKTDDYIDSKGNKKTVGINDKANLPGDKKSKEMSPAGSGGEVKKNALAKNAQMGYGPGAAKPPMAPPVAPPAPGMNKAYVSPTMTHGVSKPKPAAMQAAPKPVSDADHEADKKAAGIKTKKAAPEMEKAYVSPTMTHGTSKPKPAGTMVAPKPVSDADHAADLKAAGMKAKKAEPPMAKPPSGKNMGTTVPSAKPQTPKVGAGMQKPAGMLGKAAIPMAQMHGMADAHKEAKAIVHGMLNPKAKLTNPNDMGRADSYASAQQGGFSPKGPVHSGLELDRPKKLGKSEELSKSLGVCLMCGNMEHADSCGLPNNLKKAVQSKFQSKTSGVAISPITQGVPARKPAGAAYGHVSDGLGPHGTSIVSHLQGHLTAPGKKKKIVTVTSAPVSLAGEATNVGKAEQTPTAEETKVGQESSKGGKKKPEETSRNPSKK